MGKRKGVGKSATPDGDLDLHQLHCRYAILWGADMKVANELWAAMKGRYPNREEHIRALKEHFNARNSRSNEMDAFTATTQQTEPAFYDKLAAIEGVPHL